MSIESAQLADRLGWRRARVAQVLAFVFIATQVGSFDAHPLNRPQMLSLSAWLCWVVGLLALLATGGALLRGRRIRALLNDETTRDHQLRAMAWGFWTAILVALAVYVLSFFTVIAASEGVRLVITGASRTVRRELLMHGLRPPLAKYRESISRAMSDIKTPLSEAQGATNVVALR